MDGKLTLAGLDWRAMTPARLLNVLTVLMQEDLLTSREQLFGQVKLRKFMITGDLEDLVISDTDDPFDTPDSAAWRSYRSANPPRGTMQPLSELDDNGLPMGLREAPIG